MSAGKRITPAQPPQLARASYPNSAELDLDLRAFRLGCHVIDRVVAAPRNGVNTRSSTDVVEGPHWARRWSWIPPRLRRRGCGSSYECSRTRQDRAALSENRSKAAVVAIARTVARPSTVTARHALETLPDSP